MNKRAAALTAAVFLSACAEQPVRYAPTVLAPQLPSASLPKLLLEDVVNNAGGGVVSIHDGQTVAPVIDRVEWGDVVRDALALELKRLGWPTTESRTSAGARLRATVEAARTETNPPGFSIPLKTVLSIDVVLQAADGRDVWETELKGVGRDSIAGGGWEYGSRKASNEALGMAMTRFSAALADERPWERLAGGNPAAVSSPPERVQAPVSDIDQLPPAGPVNPHAYAVAIGVERYRGRLPNADFAASDARLAAEYFKRVLGVPEDNVAVLTDEFAGKNDFEKYLERWLPNKVRDGDVVYVYYSGHGAPNPAKADAYLVPYDGDPTYIETTGYSVKRLYDQLAKLPSKQVYVAIDSCFSGAGGRSVMAAGARPLVTLGQVDVPSNLTVLSASAGNQISNGYQEKGHGLFTYFFLKGLREKKGDLRAAFDYAKPEVARVARGEDNSDQVPEWRTAQ